MRAAQAAAKGWERARRFLGLAQWPEGGSNRGMRRLIAFLTLLFLLVPAWPAEQWRSDRFRCSLTFPEGESWVQGTPVPLPAGEMIYLASHSVSKQSVAVIVIPKIPNND